MGKSVQDPSSLANLEYNDAAGSKKVSEVGRHLLPLQYVDTGVIKWTTDASTAVALQNMGACLAVYNKDTSVHAVTLGEDGTVSAQAAGAVDLATGHVGIACAPGAWTYIACANQNWVITDSNKLLVYLIDDNTYIRQEATR